MEIATSAQMPTESCNVHGEAKARLVRDLPASGFPRASLAVDPTQVSPVSVQGPVLLAENDPYNAVNSTIKPRPVRLDANENMPDPTKPVLKAKAIEPDPDKPVAKAQVEPDPNKPVLKAEPVEPESTKRIPRAQPVEPTPQPKEIRRAQPVHPADEIPSDQILRSTPPPAADLDD